MTREERAAIVEYLSANFRPGGKIYINQADAKDLETALEISAPMPKRSFVLAGAQGDFKSFDDLKKKVPALIARKWNEEGSPRVLISYPCHPRNPWLFSFVYLNPNGFASLTFDVDPDALRLQVLANRFHSAFTSEARSLESTKRCHVARHAIAVHPHGSGFQSLRHDQRAPDAAGPDTGRQSVDCRVRDSDRFLFIVERNQREKRTEDLFVGDPHLRPDAREDCRFDKPARAALGTMRRPASKQAYRSLRLSLPSYSRGLFRIAVAL